MAGKDEFLFGESDSDPSFSGFSESDIESEVSSSEITGKGKKLKRGPTKVKSSVKKVTGPAQKSKKSSDKANKSSDKANKSSDKTGKSSDKTNKSSDRPPLLDITKLSKTDVESLRSLLGIRTEESSDRRMLDNELLHGTPADFGYHGENIRVLVDSQDISDEENNDPNNIDFSQALFGSEHQYESNVAGGNDDIDWEMPKLKTPEKGKPVSNSLAKLINLSCTAQCDTETLVDKYKIPENCQMATPPLINQEIWKILDRKSHANDKVMVDIQNLVATGFGPVIKLAELLKGQISSESKQLLSDILTVFGQIQYNLSIRRRYMIRPCLKRKYASLCQVSMPITTKLFGDDISKEVKNCESIYSLGNSTYGGYGASQRGGNPNFYRGRGRFPRRGSGATYYQPSSSRFQPYPQRGQQAARHGYSRPRPFKRAPTATVTAPNDRE